MKYILLLLAAPLLMSETCKNKKQGAIPTCIQHRIDSIKTLPRWNPPAQVDEYRYLGKTVYLFSSDCCDMYNPLYDSACNYLCAPTGGITGKGDLQCNDFTSNAQHVRLVWKDPR